MSVATVATVPTPTGPFSVIATRDDDGTEVVLASGWTAEPEELLLLVHRSLRPESVATGTPAALDTVEAYLAGDVSAIDRVPVRQLSGPFLTEAWDVLRTVPAGHADSYAGFAARCGRPAAIRAAAQACAR